MADLSAFATKDNADEGKIFPVKIDGMKLPIALKIFGDDSDVVKNHERSRLRKMEFEKDGSINKESMEDLLDTADESILVRIGGLWSYNWDEQEVDEKDPVILFGKTLGCDKKSYAFLIDKVPAIKDFVTEKAKDRNNFLS